MSIVVLQRKSRRYQAPISGRPGGGFSLNGTRRPVGRVGPVNLGRSITRTPFKGAEPVGHGGCCGAYPIAVHNSGSCCAGDNSMVHPSVVNTRGMLANDKHLGCCNFIAKAPENAGSGEHIKKLGACVAGKNGIYNTNKDVNIVCCASEKANFVGSKKQIPLIYTKDLETLGAGIYTEYLINKKNCLPPSAVAGNLPLPAWQNNNCS